jgi:nucleotide-binding universal stress UspA family protein
MYKHLLIATDGSEVAERAVKTGLGLAKALGAQATAVTVSEPWVALGVGESSVGFPFDAYEKAAGEAAARILGSVGGIARQLHVACATVHLKNTPAEGILQAAKERGCDLIVMASHGRADQTRWHSLPSRCSLPP